MQVEHLLCIRLPESAGRRPERDQSPEVREADWRGLWIVSKLPSEALRALVTSSPLLFSCFYCHCPPLFPMLWPLSKHTGSHISVLLSKTTLPGFSSEQNL